MQSCLGIYIESNLLKYAKVTKEKNDFKVEAYGIKFFDDLNQTIKSVVEETYSFNVPISINLANEKYMYYNVFSLLSKADIQKTIQTEFETFCAENRYNPKAFETRFALVPDAQDKEKIRAIQVLSNKLELNKQIQNLEKYKVAKIVPMGTAIASAAKIDKKENALIVNMEEKTIITSIYDRKIYNVEIVDFGSEEVLEKINLIENSMSKAYEICKQTTIYTSKITKSEKKQPYLEEIVATLNKICEKIQEVISNSPVQIETVYLTGTLSVVNNVDLYFQEMLTSVECKILKPSIMEGKIKQINIKDYIEVNSAISLAIQAFGEGVQALNFKKEGFKENLKKAMNSDVSLGNFFKKSEKNKLDTSEKGSNVLTKSETSLLRIFAAIVLVNIIFVIFSKILYKQMDNKQKDVERLIAAEKQQISSMKDDTGTLNKDDLTYISRMEELKAINDKIENIAKEKNSIPNLLNQIMYVIPEEVQLISLKHVVEDEEEEVATTAESENGENEEEQEINKQEETKFTNESSTDGTKVRIVARSEDYDQLGYFIAKLKVEGILLDVISSSSQKSSGYVDVTIEGVLP